MIFDILEKDRGKWLVKYAPIPEEISFEDMDADEMPVVKDDLLDIITLYERYAPIEMPYIVGKAAKRL